jgi:hypothetical protein
VDFQPSQIWGKIFGELLKELESNKLTHKDMELYRQSVLRYEDLYNFTDYAKEEGKMDGILEEKHRIAENLLEIDLSVEQILQMK